MRVSAVRSDVALVLADIDLSFRPFGKSGSVDPGIRSPDPASEPTAA